MANKWYSLFKAIFGPPLLVWNRPRIYGVENIPDEGPALLVSNHQAVLDSFYLPLMVRRQLKFPAKMEYFTGTGLSGRLQRFFFTAVGQVPIDRSSDTAGDVLLETVKKIFDDGELFGIYAEGTRSPDGRVYKGRTGMARISMPTGVPVILVGMIGSGRANPIGTKLIRPVKVQIKISEPIDPRAWAVENGYDPDSREAVRPFTDYCMHRIAEMIGEEYVDVYATDVKKSLEQTGKYPEGAEPKTGPKGVQ